MTDRVEVGSTVLLAVAAVATAWCSYQATRWNGEQATAGARTNAIRIEAARAQGLAQAQTQVDVATFTQWVDAYARQETQLADFYFERFRAEFKPAVDAWIAARPLKNPDAPLTPFAMPQYRLAATADAERLDAEAEVSAATVRRNIQRASNYVLGVVLCAVSLFFAGMSTKLRDPRLREDPAGSRQHPLRRARSPGSRRSRSAWRSDARDSGAEQRQAEPDNRRDAGERTAALVGERHQRVREHREQATGRERRHAVAGRPRRSGLRQGSPGLRDTARDDDQRARACPSRRGLQPDAARSADGAIAWGTFETNTAARKLALIGKPVAIWMPKMIDSGTPSTTEPTTMPIDPPAPSLPNRRSTMQSPPRKIADAEQHPKTPSPRTRAPRLRRRGRTRSRRSAPRPRSRRGCPRPVGEP